LKTPEEGCALCGATWGNYWETIHGKSHFFCCDFCANQYRNMANEVKRRTGWGRIDRFEMEGNYRGRICTAFNNAESYKFMISFTDKGEVRNFMRLE
jgi:hypothetical protein